MNSGGGLSLPIDGIFSSNVEVVFVICGTFALFFCDSPYASALGCRRALSSARSWRELDRKRELGGARDVRRRMALAICRVDCMFAASRRNEQSREMQDVFSRRKSSAMF